MFKGIAQAATVAMLMLTSGCVTQPPPSQTAIIFARSADAAARAVERASGVITHDLPLINAVGASISEPQLDVLANDSTVVRVVIADPSASDETQNTRSNSEIAEWLQESLSRSAVNGALHTYLETAAPALTGNGVGIAIVDTGLSPILDTQVSSAGHPLGFNALTNEPGDVQDVTGHGTHLASLISGFGDDLRGIAPDAELIAIKAFNREDSASTLDIIRAIQWAVDHRTRHNIRVLNLSISAPTDLPYYLDPLNIALTNAWGEGLVVVVSAGNEGPGQSSITAPGNNPWLLTVGAADYASEGGWVSLAPFSGRGPTDTGHIKPDIVVPGTLLAGVRPDSAKRPEGEPDHRDPNGLWITSGTSQATAIASGMIALLLEARPELSNHDIKCILANTASPLTSEGGVPLSPFSQGRGFINLREALNSNATQCEERLEGMDPSTPLQGAFPPG
jgi:serine protease AprX